MTTQYPIGVLQLNGNLRYPLKKKQLEFFCLRFEQVIVIRTEHKWVNNMIPRPNHT